THARSAHAASTSHTGRRGHSASTSHGRSSAHRGGHKSRPAVTRSSRSHSSSHGAKSVHASSGKQLTASRPHGTNGSGGGRNHPSSTATARPVHSSDSLNVAGVN